MLLEITARENMGSDGNLVDLGGLSARDTRATSVIGVSPA